MRKKRGTTLLELILVMGISAIIMISVGYLIRTGVDYYFYATTQLEVQRNGLLSLSILTQEFTGSTFEGLYTDKNLPNPGFVFAVSKDDDDRGPKRSASGNLLWTRMVAYYIDEIDGVKMLIRKEVALPDSVGNEKGELNPPDALALGYDIAYFQALNDPGRVMARHISDLQTEELTDSLKITMTSEIKEGRNWLEMDVSTTIVPRN